MMPKTPKSGDVVDRFESDEALALILLASEVVVAIQAG
jgi:hypothetical protein